MEENTTEEKTEKMQFSIHDILKLMPHRYPFLMIDKVIDIERGISGVGIKNVTINEPFFAGHFPENPVMPGVLQIEAMAQTACMVVLSEMDESERAGNSVYFMTVNDVKFRKPVLPGDVLEFHVQKEQTVRNVYKFKGEARVNGAVVCQATFSAMVFKKS